MGWKSAGSLAFFLVVNLLFGCKTDSSESSLEDIGAPLDVDAWLRVKGAGFDSDYFVRHIRPRIFHLVSSSGMGTGFFIDEDGYFLTNMHVVDSCVRQTEEPTAGSRDLITYRKPVVCREMYGLALHDNVASHFECIRKAEKVLVSARVYPEFCQNHVVSGKVNESWQTVTQGECGSLTPAWPAWFHDCSKSGEPVDADEIKKVMNSVVEGLTMRSHRIELVARLPVEASKPAGMDAFSVNDFDVVVARLVDEAGNRIRTSEYFSLFRTSIPREGDRVFAAGFPSYKKFHEGQLEREGQAQGAELRNFSSWWLSLTTGVITKRLPSGNLVSGSSSDDSGLDTHHGASGSPVFTEGPVPALAAILYGGKNSLRPFSYMVSIDRVLARYFRPFVDGEDARSILDNLRPAGSR